MPSGAKKRKAAKKKKQNQANFNSSVNGSLGDEDVKSQGGKSSGSEEVNVDALYDNGSNGELEKNEAISIESIVVEDESSCIERSKRNEETEYEREFEGNCMVEIANELISAENCDGRSISIEYVESGNEFYERDDEDIASSSDDRSSIPDKKIDVYTSIYETNSFDVKADSSLPADAIQITKVTAIEESMNSLVKPAMVAVSVKSDVSLPTGTTCLTKVADVENTAVPDIVESGLKEDADKFLSKPVDGTGASVTYPDSVPKENNDKVVALSGENDQASSDVMEHGSKYLEGKTCLSTDAPVIDAGKSDAIANNSGIAKCFKNQTSSSAPLVAQRTSLFGCCGFFDLLKGSNG